MLIWSPAGVFGEKITLLPESAREVLSLVSAAGQLTVTQLSEIVDEAQVRSALDAAADGDVATVGAGSMVVFTHPLLASAVYEAASSTLDACRYRHMMAAVARAATTSDVFNAIAEPQRRDILVLLRAGERPVTELARELGMTQPGASKHLRVLREVGLVRDRKAGKQRLYGLDARGLRPVHEWTGGFERFWNESFDRLDAYVQDLRQARQEE